MDYIYYWFNNLVIVNGNFWALDKLEVYIYLKVLLYGQEKEWKDIDIIINLPRNYIEIEEEEMMYLDGGYAIDWSRQTTGRVIDVSIAAITCGFSLWMGYRQLVNYFGKKKMKTYITKAVTRVGIYTGMASSIATFTMTLLNFSVGGAIAYALDRFDRSGLNKRIQF